MDNLFDISEEEMERIAERLLQEESRGGWRDCICEVCLKPGKGYLESLPYGTVRLGVPHWICPECIAKWEERKNETLESI